MSVRYRIIRYEGADARLDGTLARSLEGSVNLGTRANPLNITATTIAESDIPSSIRAEMTALRQRQDGNWAACHITEGVFHGK